MTGSSTGDRGTREHSSIFSETILFFTSVKTTIWLLFLLAAASILGTLIPQGTSLEELRHTASPFYFRLIAILDLNYLFASWWFLLLLTLLAINLLACLLNRIPAILADWRGTSGKRSFRFSLADPRQFEDVKHLVTSSLGRVFRASPHESKTGGGLMLSWETQKIHLLGFPLIHVAIVVILTGGLIGLLYGFKGHLLINEGEVKGTFTLAGSGEVRPLPFRIAVDRFILTRYPTGQPKEFRSDVRLLENGKEALKGAILVNHPLTFQGISLYQSDYRLLGIRSVKLGLTGPDGTSRDLVIEPGSSLQLPDTEYKLKLLSFDPGTTPKGMGVQLAVEGPGEQPGTIGVFSRVATPVTVGKWEIRFLDYRPFYATGLQVGYDPGSGVVWIGCTMLILGFLLTLFTNHRHVHVEMKQETGGTWLEISGSSRRLRREFRETVESTLRDVLELEKRESP